MHAQTRFAKHFAQSSPIFELMDDLGEALNNNPTIKFLGGGNPAHIPQAAQCFARHLRQIAEGQEGDHLMGIYQSPQGNEQTIDALVTYYRTKCGWDISKKNVE